MFVLAADQLVEFLKPRVKIPILTIFTFLALC